jgi:putative ABC transport system substrate-binding protein
MNSKKVFCFVLGAMLVALALPTQAQQPKKVARIGFLTAVSQTGISHLAEAFLQGLRDLGYVEGQNISIEYRWADGNFERLPALAAELVRLKVDVIVATVTQASLAAKDATATIPIVMVAVGSPVEARLVASLARPGANITGTSTMADEVVGKQLGLLKETLPKISRIATLWNPANPVFQASQVRQAESAAKALPVTLQKLEARDAAEIVHAFTAISKEDTKALIVLSDPVFTTHRNRIADLALKHRLPAITGPKEVADAGLLMSYGASFTESYRRAAIYVDKILKGAKPADMPVERPTKFDFVINLKTARQFGLTVPQSMLYRADFVIK